MTTRWQRSLGFLLGVAGPIVLPLLVETLVSPPRQGPLFVPQSFIDASEAIDQYRAEHGRVPSEQEGLAGLVPAFLPAVPRDPWTGEPYLYRPDRDSQSADLFSFGRDGRPGGEGADADVSLRALTMGPPAPAPDPTAGWLVNLAFLLTPVGAFAASFHWPRAAPVLAGSACFGGVLLAAVAFGRAAPGVPLAFALITAAASLGGGAIVLREMRGARTVALVSLFLAWAQIALLAS